jgi:hypothetical protein
MPRPSKAPKIRELLDKGLIPPDAARRARVTLATVLRVALIRDLAAAGKHGSEIAALVGVSEDFVGLCSRPARRRR